VTTVLVSHQEYITSSNLEIRRI